MQWNILISTHKGKKNHRIRRRSIILIWSLFLSYQCLLTTNYDSYIHNLENTSKIISITICKNSGKDPLIEGARFKIPDLIGMVEQSLAHELRPRWREPNQMHLGFQKSIKSLQFTEKILIRDSKVNGENPTSFSSLRLRVPARKLVCSASALTSAMHLACESNIEF